MMPSFVVSAVLHARAFYRLACFWGLWSASLANAQAHESQVARCIFPLILFHDLNDSRAGFVQSRVVLVCV